MVWPSCCARATLRKAATPPPAGCGSTSTCWPQASDNFWPNSRAMVSGPGPTTMNTGRVGKSCAHAGRAHNAIITASVTRASRPDMKNLPCAALLRSRADCACFLTSGRRRDIKVISGNRKCGWGHLLQCEPELRDERGAAPARHETQGISYRVDASAGCGIGIAGEDEAILLRQVGVVVAQVEIEDRAAEGHAGIPIDIGGQREAAQCRRLIAEPIVASNTGHRSGDFLRQRVARQVDAQA